MTASSKSYAEEVGQNAEKRRRARSSAEVILPLLLELTSARSIVDVGCGVGTWLTVASELGAEEVHGIDSDPSDLDIPEPCFTAHDLERPLELDRSFDLAISLEVGEHLTPAAGKQLVATLTSLAPVVAFSAAVPGQGGTRHINERWQDEWAADFADVGYVPTDPIRPLIWDDPRVRYFYAQNLVVYVREDVRDEYSKLTSGLPLRVVHPHLYEVTRGLFPAPERAKGGDFIRFAAKAAGVRRLRRRR